MKRGAVSEAHRQVVAGWTRFLVMASGVALVCVVVAVMLWPSISDYEVEYLRLGQYERPFGFVGGRVHVASPKSSLTEVYGFVEIVPGGRLARAGVSADDIPLRSWSFYHPLRSASSGRADGFKVISRSQWGNWEKARTITLTADVEKAR